MITHNEKMHFVRFWSRCLYRDGVMPFENVNIFDPDEYVFDLKHLITYCIEFMYIVGKYFYEL